MADHPAVAVRDTLAADLMLSAIWPGGIYAEHEEPGDEDPSDAVAPIDPERTPDAYSVGADGVALIKPCGLVSVSSDTRFGPGGCFRQIFLRLGGYQREGYTGIREGLLRARQVLDKTTGMLDDGTGYLIEYVDTPITASVDDSLIGSAGKRPVSYEASRFKVIMEGL